MISVCFQGKPFNITVIQVYVPTTNAEEAEVEWFSEDLQTIIGDWNAKVRSQEIHELPASLTLEYKMKQGKG